MCGIDSRIRIAGISFELTANVIHTSYTLARPRTLSSRLLGQCAVWSKHRIMHQEREFPFPNFPTGIPWKWRPGTGMEIATRECEEMVIRNSLIPPYSLLTGIVTKP